MPSPRRIKGVLAGLAEQNAALEAENALLRERLAELEAPVIPASPPVSQKRKPAVKK